MTKCRIPFWGHCDLDLVFRIIVSRAYALLFELGIPNLVCGCILGWQSAMYQFGGDCDLDLFSRIIVRSISHILFEVGIPNSVYGCIFGW